MSEARGIVERMFEDVSEVALIDVMGEATRDESTAIAQRLAAVAELLSGDPVPWLSVSGGVPMLVMRWPRKCRRRRTSAMPARWARCGSPEIVEVSYAASGLVLDSLIS